MQFDLLPPNMKSSLYQRSDCVGLPFKITTDDHQGIPRQWKLQQHRAHKQKPWLAEPGAAKPGVTLCRCRANGELLYMLEFLFVWAWPRFQAPGGSELAGVLLGIKPGPGAGKKMAGVYCSCGCLEVTGRKHARFVKMNRGQRHKTDKLFIQGRRLGPHLLHPENYTNSIHV